MIRKHIIIILTIGLLLITIQKTFAADDSNSSAFADKATGDWGGVRQDLQQKGIDIGISLIPEIFDNFSGGIRKGVVGASTIDLSAALDTEKAYHWQGGKLYIDLEDHAGSNPSNSLVGDLQGFDNQNYSPYLEIFEFWYQQIFWDNKFRIKLGRVDANSEFSVIENGLIFLNSTSQSSPTILSFPSPPDPALSANVFFTPVEFWYLGVGAYDANRHDRFGIISGNPENNVIMKYGQLYMGETGFLWRSAPVFKKNGNFKLGVWTDTGTFMRLEGENQNGATGYYGIFNQTLWQPTGETENGRGIRSYLSYGYTQPSVGVIDRNYSAGLTWTGISTKRSEDVLGISANYGNISTQAGLHYPYELALEGLYQIKLSQWAFLVPDLQYIIHPGGQYPNALVGTLRMQIQL